MDDSKLPPSNREEWRALAKKKIEGNKTIHDINLASASKFKLEQYLMLRVLWKSSRNHKFNPATFGLGEWVERATIILDQYKSWGQYCSSFDQQKSLPEGTFALPRFYQRQAARVPQDAPCRSDVTAGPPTPISRRTRSQVGTLNEDMKKLSLETPTKSRGTPRMPLSSGSFDDEDAYEDEDEDTPPGQRSYGPPELLDINFPKTKDEQIVNTAFIDFLNAFIIHLDYSVQWTLYRRPFIAEFAKASLEARTDGCLEGVDSKEKVHALVEVKPLLREKGLLTIAMQEAAQMVAWIKSDPDPDGFKYSCGR